MYIHVTTMILRSSEDSKANKFWLLNKPQFYFPEQLRAQVRDALWWKMDVDMS